MSKKLRSGEVTDEAAAVLAALSKNKSRGPVVSDAIVEYGSVRGVTIHHHEGWFNNWFSQNKLVIAIRVRLRLLASKMKPLKPVVVWFAGIAVGVAGTLYYVGPILAGR